MIKKMITAVIAEHVSRWNKGGPSKHNIEHYLFAADKEIIVSDNVMDMEINDSIIVNSKFPLQIHNVRDTLNEKIAAAIIETKFVSPINKDGSISLDNVSAEIKNIDIEKYISGQERDIPPVDAFNRIAFASMLCSELSKHIDKNEDGLDVILNNVLNTLLNAVYLPEVVYAVRMYIGLNRIIKNNLDNFPIITKMANDYQIMLDPEDRYALMLDGSSKPRPD